MASPRLQLVALPAEPPPETAAQRIRRLQQEAHSLAREQVEEMARAMLELARLAGEVAEGGDAYPVGARELARRLVEELGQKSSTLQAILRKS